MRYNHNLDVSRRDPMKRQAPRNASRAIAYIRVSKDIQDLSPDAQRAAISRWATANTVVVVATV